MDQSLTWLFGVLMMLILLLVVFFFGWAGIRLDLELFELCDSEGGCINEASFRFSALHLSPLDFDLSFFFDFMLLLIDSLLLLIDSLLLLTDPLLLLTDSLLLLTDSLLVWAFCLLDFARSLVRRLAFLFVWPCPTSSDLVLN